MGVAVSYFPLNCPMAESNAFKKSQFGYVFLSILSFRFSCLLSLNECH